METRANYALIGVFTLAVIASAFLFVFWISGTGKETDQRQFRIVFSGSVVGLSNGAYVLFNGLRVGEVKKIGLMDDDSGRVQALVNVDSKAPIKIDSHAKLEYAGFTGIASLELTSGTVQSPPLVSGDGAELPTIFADRSDLQNIMLMVQNLSGRLDSILEKTDGLLGESNGSIRASLANVQKFTQILADNSDNVSTFMQSAGAIGESLQPLGPKLAQLSSDADALIQAIDAKRVNDILSQVDSVLNENRVPLTETLANIRILSQQLLPLANQAGDMFEGGKQLIAAIDPKELKSTVDNVANASTKLSGLSDQASEVIASFDKGKIQAMVENANELSSKLNASASKIDGLMDSAQKLLGSPETTGALNDVADAARSVKKLADNLDLRTKDILVGLTRFSNQGLRDYQNLALTAQQTLVELTRTLQSFQKNPNQLIFGGNGSVPEYSGR